MKYFSHSFTQLFSHHRITSWMFIFLLKQTLPFYLIMQHSTVSSAISKIKLSSLDLEYHRNDKLNSLEQHKLESIMQLSQVQSLNQSAQIVQVNFQELIKTTHVQYVFHISCISCISYFMVCISQHLSSYQHVVFISTV